MTKKKDKSEIRTLHQQAWNRAMKGEKPKVATPYDWQDYEKSKEKKDG